MWFCFDLKNVIYILYIFTQSVCVWIKILPASLVNGYNHGTAEMEVVQININIIRPSQITFWEHATTIDTLSNYG